eukprot:315984_1
MSALSAYLVLATFSTCVLSAYLVWKYSRRNVSLGAKAVIFSAWFCVFELVILLPADMYTSKTSNIYGALRFMFSSMYWFSYALTWAVLPLGYDYHAAGDFTRLDKFRTSVLSNVRYYVVVGVLFVAFIVYLLATDGISADGLVGFCVSLANAWGLTLLVLTMGYGLVEIPRKLWYSGNPEIRLNHMYFKVSAIHDELEETKEAFVETKDLVDYAHRKIPEGHSRSADLNTIEERMVEYSALDCSSALNRNFLPSTFAESFKANSGSISGKQLATLNARVHTQGAELARLIEQYGRTLSKVAEAEGVLAVAEGEMTPPVNVEVRDSWSWRFRHHYKRHVLRLSAVGLAVLSGLILWSELTLPWELSPFMRVSQTNSVGAFFLSLIVASYMAFCAFFALFRVRVSSYFHVHDWHGTDMPSLMLAATLMIRISVAIAFNFITIMGVEDNSAFQSLMGKLKLVPLLGTSFNVYIPVTIGLISLCTIFNVYGRVMALLDIDRFDFSAGSAASTELVAEGRRIVRREARVRERITRQEERHVRGEQSGFIRLSDG